MVIGMELSWPGGGGLALDRPRIVGVLNVTPDSFSDGGRFAAVDEAVTAGVAMARAGADVIDIGGESTRPGAQRVSATQQIDRVVGVIAALARQLPQVPISIDTTRVEVAAAALDAGATMLNDISAGRESGDAMLALAAERGAPIVLMHMRGEPGTMQAQPRYDDVVGEVHGFLQERAAAAEGAGVPRSQIVLDPGIGFGKTVAHNLSLLASLDRLVGLGYPVLLGASRKRFIAEVSPHATDAMLRLGGTAATTALGVAAGVHLFRVHDVAANRQAADVAWAVRRAGERVEGGEWGVESGE